MFALVPGVGIFMVEISAVEMQGAEISKELKI